eukprot:GHVT01007296.1.p2 GENE.GHVT01007296.1~~GHVT01007296.1.p2  ORF type:complete len:124 (-),score=6.64 GHVT01007296.1:268-585(-)
MAAGPVSPPVLTSVVSSFEELTGSFTSTCDSTPVRAVVMGAKLLLGRVWRSSLSLLNTSVSVLSVSLPAFSFSDLIFINWDSAILHASLSPFRSFFKSTNSLPIL